MSDTKKILADWRAEIAQDLEEARKTLATAEKEHGAATTAAGVVSSVHRELQSTLRDITHRPAGLASLPLAGPLALRLDEHKRAADVANNHKAQTHAACQAAARRISELEAAISQIDQLTAPTDTEEAA